MKFKKICSGKNQVGNPVLFIEEGLHGYCGIGIDIPNTLQLSAAWDTSLVHSVGRL